MTPTDPHPAYAVPCRAESVVEPASAPSHDAGEARVQLYLALRARDGRPFAAAYTASVAHVVDPVAPVAPDRAQLSLFGLFGR